jgi:hypothetical protein
MEQPGGTFGLPEPRSDAPWGSVFPVNEGSAEFGAEGAAGDSNIQPAHIKPMDAASRINFTLFLPMSIPSRFNMHSIVRHGAESIHDAPPGPVSAGPGGQMNALRLWGI